MLPDVNAIYALKLEAFGETTLPFTIYRAPAAIKHLCRIIEGTSRNGEDYIAVAETRGRVMGYYQATEHQGQFFLNYIAVHPSSQGQGIGTALLDDFEQRGHARGFEHFGMDAVQSNQAVLDWYAKRGYSHGTTLHHVRIAVPTEPRIHSPLRWDEQVWRQALAEESEWGFAKFDATLGSGRIELGLIEQCACKLLRYTEVGLAAAVDGILLRFAGLRTEFILSGLPSTPEQWQWLQYLVTVRLIKVGYDRK
jgi:GNAT superfamily N-acetyltransferase